VSDENESTRRTSFGVARAMDARSPDRPRRPPTLFVETTPSGVEIGLHDEISVGSRTFRVLIAAHGEDAETAASRFEALTLASARCFESLRATTPTVAVERSSDVFVDPEVTP
jgi:hypothetical protein